MHISYSKYRVNYFVESIFSLKLFIYFHLYAINYIKYIFNVLIKVVGIILIIKLIKMFVLNVIILSINQ